MQGPDRAGCSHRLRPFCRAPRCARGVVCHQVHPLAPMSTCVARYSLSSISGRTPHWYPSATWNDPRTTRLGRAGRPDWSGAGVGWPSGIRREANRPKSQAVRRQRMATSRVRMSYNFRPPPFSCTNESTPTTRARQRVFAQSTDGPPPTAAYTTATSQRGRDNYCRRSPLTTGLCTYPATRTPPHRANRARHAIRGRPAGSGRRRLRRVLRCGRPRAVGASRPPRSARDQTCHPPA